MVSAGVNLKRAPAAKSSLCSSRSGRKCGTATVVYYVVFFIISLTAVVPGSLIKQRVSVDELIYDLYNKYSHKSCCDFFSDKSTVVFFPS